MCARRCRTARGKSTRRAPHASRPAPGWNLPTLLRVLCFVCGAAATRAGLRKTARARARRPGRAAGLEFTQTAAGALLCVRAALPHCAALRLWRGVTDRSGQEGLSTGGGGTARRRRLTTAARRRRLRPSTASPPRGLLRTRSLSLLAGCG